MENARPGTVTLCAGSVGGIVALGSTIVVIASFFIGPVIDPTPLNLLALAMAGAAGIVALAHPREMEPLVVADILVGLSVAEAMYARGGMVFLPALLLLMLGTVRSRSKEDLEPEATSELASLLEVRGVTPEPEELRRAG